MTKDPRVDAYIGRAAAFAKPILRHLRRLVHEGVPEVEEGIRWSSPSFLVGGQILCGMAAFQKHCAFGFWHKGMQTALGADGKSGEAMGSLGRIMSLRDLPSDRAMARYFRQAVALHESGVPARPRPKRSPAAPVAVPSDLKAGLRGNKAAGSTFERLSPSGRKDYVEWITEARRAETRQKRLSTALEWLAEGKGRNWKYENC